VHNQHLCKKGGGWGLLLTRDSRRHKRRTRSILGKNPLRCFALGALTAIALVSAAAQNSPFASEKRAQIEKAVSAFMTANSAPGVSIAIVQNGQPVWSSGFGMADLENSAPATSSTLYRLGSISKPITAVALLQLYEHGKLDLDAPVQKYCPDFPQKDAPITSRQLLGHLSGIRHYNQDGKGDVPEDSARHFSTMAEALQLFASDPLLSKPGTQFHYSTYGYTVLGCVLEGAASQKYAGFVTENVFHPAAMNHTQVDNFFAVIPHRTRWYHRDKTGAVQNAGVLDSSYKIPGGGLISSADDMANFEAAVLAGKLLKPATQQMMWTVQHNSAGEPTGYALGWGITDRSGLHLIAHSGGQQGTSTSIILAPQKSAAVVVLANMDNLDASALAESLLKITLDLP
jgi:serine beta-lactamase-like protein LACTB